MIRTIIVAALCLFLTACSHVQRRPEAAEKNVVVARAFLSNESCPSAPDQGQSESAVAAAVVSWAIAKGAELVVNYVANAVGEAAKEDRETYTITGQNTDYLFSVSDSKPTLRKCLYAVVAPSGLNGDWCEAGKAGNWYNTESCSVSVKELTDRWKEWGLGEPLIYAEIGLQTPSAGPETVLKPVIYRLHYPKPISSIAASKVKGLTLVVSAAKPSKSNRTSGDIALEIFIGGDGLTPNSRISANSPWLNGLWAAIPPADGKLGSEFAVPVNMTVTFAETPHPTPWLQAVAKFVDANKQKAVDALVERVDPSKREAKEETEAVSSLNLLGAAAESCIKLSMKIEDLETKQKAARSGGTGEEGLKLKYGLDAACAVAQLQLRSSQSAWAATSLDQSNLCHRGKSEAVRAKISSLCQQ